MGPETQDFITLQKMKDVDTMKNIPFSDLKALSDKKWS